MLVKQTIGFMFENVCFGWGPKQVPASNSSQLEARNAAVAYIHHPKKKAMFGSNKRTSTNLTSNDKHHDNLTNIIQHLPFNRYFNMFFFNVPILFWGAETPFPAFQAPGGCCDFVLPPGNKLRPALKDVPLRPMVETFGHITTNKGDPKILDMTNLKDIQNKKRKKTQTYNI